MNHSKEGGALELKYGLGRGGQQLGCRRGDTKIQDKLLNHRFVVVCRYYIQVSDLDIEK